MGGGEPSPSPGVSQQGGVNDTDQEALAKKTVENNTSIVSGGGGVVNGKDDASTLQPNKAIEPSTSIMLEYPPHEVAAAATENPLNVNDSGGGGLSSAKHAERQISRSYTKEEFMVKYWGVSPEQEKRVKALLQLGVNEDDLVIANRLLKLGSEKNDTPWTKEEQLLGYTASQRQRIKALHTLGLTEGSLERCRALMLSSLGPSAFGVDADKAAKNAARAAEEEDWTPSDATRRWDVQSMNDVYGMFFKKKYSNDAQSTLLDGSSLRNPEKRLPLHFPKIEATGRNKAEKERGFNGTGTEDSRGVGKGWTVSPFFRRTDPG